MRMTPSNDLVVLSGKRTPFGKFGGAYRDLSPVELGVASAEAALKEAGVPAADISHVIYGQVLQSAADSIYTARHIGLKSGVPIATPALQINRLCGSGFEVIAQAQMQFKTEVSRVALVGGVENMSMTPYVLRKARFGNKFGNFEAVDQMTESLTDPYVGLPMALTAENLAEQYGISKTECDAYALLSQTRFAEALKRGIFNEEIVPYKIGADEHPKGDSTLESIQKLPAIFKKGGTVSAANASGIVDGAGSLVVSTQAYAHEKNLKPLAILRAYNTQGCDPKIMGIGPVLAIRALLAEQKLTIADIDLFEINEAFAAQVLAVNRELNIPSEKLNVNGGAIAVGHPLAASGARLSMHLIYEMRRRGLKLGIASACIGGGQGIALLFESV